MTSDNRHEPAWGKIALLLGAIALVTWVAPGVVKQLVPIVVVFGILITIYGYAGPRVTN